MLLLPGSSRPIPMASPAVAKRIAETPSAQNDVAHRISTAGSSESNDQPLHLPYGRSGCCRESWRYRRCLHSHGIAHQPLVRRIVITTTAKNDLVIAYQPTDDPYSQDRLRPARHRSVPCCQCSGALDRRCLGGKILYQRPAGRKDDVQP